jgi:GDP-D-mannose 3', 5'-epimerase
MLTVVAGAGGFIGGHLVADLLRKGHTNVRAIDIKPLDQWWQLHPQAENWQIDLRNREGCDTALEGAAEVYNLAADMGGMGFIENNKALCMISVLINTHLLLAAKEQGIRRYFYASSACVYAADKQKSEDVIPLKEEDAYPAMPEDGYGWEKLFAERMCRHFREDFGLTTRVARFHNVYGPHGTWTGGREKAPAAICRKVIEAKLSGKHEIEIWGDGKQTRSFTFIGDCLKGTQMIMQSAIDEPINLGSDEVVTINQLVDIVEDIAGVELRRKYNLTAPKGVNGRNSDNTRIKQLLGWAPSTHLRDGLEKTYAWIHDQVTSDAPCPAY